VIDIKPETPTLTARDVTALPVSAWVRRPRAQLMAKGLPRWQREHFTIEPRRVA
jgi:hypothetical protein